MLIESALACLPEQCPSSYSYTTLKFETSLVDPVGARSITNYKQETITEVGNSQGMSRNVNSTVYVTFDTDESSFYLGIQANDTSACNFAMFRMIVFYHICPLQTVGLIVYPETIAPPFLTDQGQGSTSSISVNAGVCVENAQPENGEAPVVRCSSEGIWSLDPGEGCQCAPGYTNVDGMCTCERSYIFN